MNSAAITYAKPPAVPMTRGPQTGPNITGTVAIPDFVSPSTSFRSFICDHRKDMIITANMADMGKVDSILDLEKVKKPAIKIETQFRIMINDDNTGALFRRVGGIE